MFSLRKWFKTRKRKRIREKKLAEAYQTLKFDLLDLQHFEVFERHRTQRYLQSRRDDERYVV